MPPGPRFPPPLENSCSMGKSPSSPNPFVTDFGFLRHFRRIETTIQVFPDDGEEIIGKVVSDLSKEAGRMAEVRQVVEGVYHVTFFMPWNDPLLRGR